MTDAGIGRSEPQLLAQSPGHGEGSNASRLGAGDGAGKAATHGQGQFGQLGRLAGTGLAGHDHDLMLRERLAQLLPVIGDR